MARAKIRLIHPGMKALLNDPGVRDDLTERAERVADSARSSAPVATGEYRDSIHVLQGTTDRAAVRVGTTAPHGLVVEARTGNLARALDAAGGS